MSNPAIVVIAFNRDKSLKRLLDSIANATYFSDQITLHISIDGSENPEVKVVAENFDWKYGEKVIDLKTENLGLLKHVLECGSLTEVYGTIIVLEDDLVVAPNFYNYAIDAQSFYLDDQRIAGVSLYSYSSEENNFYPFEPLRNETDIHFIQIASSWGQSWNISQWNMFKSWIAENRTGMEHLLPNYIIKWGENSWKKLFVNYMIATNRYFVFPNISYSTNFDEEGTHASNLGLFQVQLNGGLNKLKFSPFSETKAIYDVYFELEASSMKLLNHSLNNYKFDVDLYGSKPMNFSDSEMILTTHRGLRPIMSFGAKMKPLIQNIEFEIVGKEIGLYNKADVILSQPKRFLSLNSSPVRINQYSALKKQELEIITLVIPVNYSNLEELEVTLSTIPTDRFYEINLLVSCSQNSADFVEKFLKQARVYTEIVTLDSNDFGHLLRKGLQACRTDYCGWIQAGMKLNVIQLEGLASVFRGMAQVQIIRGVHENRSKKSAIANYRWTPNHAIIYKEKIATINSELIIWRKSLFPNIEGVLKNNSGVLFIELLKVNPIYVIDLKLGDFNGKEPLFKVDEQEVVRTFQDQGFHSKNILKIILRPILRPIFRSLFIRNVPIFRLLYKEMEKLPLIIRYDDKHDSFYLDNY